jgi:protein-tyrosine phosphatase
LIDIHSHILPGLDDGAMDLKMALQMAAMAESTGIHGIIATPHVIKGVFDNNRQVILDAIDRLRLELQKSNISLNIMPGAEYHLEPDLARRLKNNELLTLNDTGRYLLVELPRTLVPDFTTEILYELQLAGVIPVIAHPERNYQLMENHALLEAIGGCGAVMQLTATSLTGLFGNRVQKNAWRLISEGYSCVVASDAHSLYGRRPRLDEAYLRIRKRLGQHCAQLLCLENPRRLSEGQDLKPCPKIQLSPWQRFKQVMANS